MKLVIVAGARPNFMKISPIIHEINKLKDGGVDIFFDLVHTGQHYDKNMSSNFFQELGIPYPTVNLECGSGSQSEITSKIMISFEKFLIKNPCDLVIVVGDVTSTMACAIVSKKLNIKVAHIESGIRSYDMSMPEEINRIVTDSITDYHFTTSETANKNLKKIGVSEENIFFVGNTMIDSLLKNIQKFKKPKIWDDAGLTKKKYVVITLHRPSNVDDGKKLSQIINEIINSTSGLDLIFPMHPRTHKNFIKNNKRDTNDKLHIIPPLSYFEFNYLVKNSLAVFTDSGGITEETTVMNIPCMTFRDNTERPETITQGTNELLGTNISEIKPAFKKLTNNKWKKGSIPKYWDGKTSERIMKQIRKLLEN